MNDQEFYWDSVASLETAVPTIKGRLDRDGSIVDFPVDAADTPFLQELYDVHESTFAVSPSGDCSNYDTDKDVCFPNIDRIYPDAYNPNFEGSVLTYNGGIHSIEPFKFNAGEFYIDDVGSWKAVMIVKFKAKTSSTNDVFYAMQAWDFQILADQVITAESC